jgi:hypothetical protein
MSDDPDDWTTIRAPTDHDDSVVEARRNEIGQVEIRWRDREASDHLSLTAHEADALAAWLTDDRTRPMLEQWSDRSPLPSRSYDDYARELAAARSALADARLAAPDDESHERVAEMHYQVQAELERALDELGQEDSDDE